MGSGLSVSDSLLIKICMDEAIKHFSKRLKKRKVFCSEHFLQYVDIELQKYGIRIHSNK